MNALDIQCMQHSIELANSAKTNGLKVGIVIHVNKNHFLTATSITNKSQWLKTILKTLKATSIKRVLAIYLSINTVSSNGEFDLNLLLNVVSAHNIFVGLPDPTLYYYKDDDPMIINSNIDRYPDSLQKLILNQNINIYSKSKQNIKLSPYYSDVRISNLVQSKLKRHGIDISKEIINSHKSIKKLSQYIVTNNHLLFEQASQLVNKVLSESFNEKYAVYDYRQDARSLNSDWYNTFKKITDRYLQPYSAEKNIINVGVGSGEEAIQLFSKCKNISFVDIAPGGLNNIVKSLTTAHTFLLRAENLFKIKDNTYDIYISLRTYNSSFFDTSLALKEARRVLKNDGVIIISVANGFLCVDDHIIPGLIIPGLEFVDIYRGLNLAKNLLLSCKDLGFESMEIYPTNTEIYIIGKLNK